MHAEGNIDLAWLLPKRKMHRFSFHMHPVWKILWFIVLLFLASRNIDVCEAGKPKSLPSKSHVVLPQIGQAFVTNNRELMAASVQKNFIDFVEAKIFKFFTTDAERTEQINPERFKSLMGKDMNRQLKLQVGRKAVTFGKVLTVLSGYTKLGFFPNLEKGTSKRITVMMDVNDAGVWLKNYKPLNFGVDTNNQILIYDHHNKLLPYEDLFKDLDKNVRTVVPVRSFFQSCFAGGS